MKTKTKTAPTAEIAKKHYILEYSTSYPGGSHVEYYFCHSRTEALREAVQKHKGEGWTVSWNDGLTDENSFPSLPKLSTVDRSFPCVDFASLWPHIADVWKWAELTDDEDLKSAYYHSAYDMLTAEGLVVSTRFDYCDVRPAADEESFWECALNACDFRSWTLEEEKVEPEVVTEEDRFADLEADAEAGRKIPLADYLDLLAWRKKNGNLSQVS